MKGGVNVISMVAVEVGVIVEASVLVAACEEGKVDVLVAVMGGFVPHAETIMIKTASAKPDPCFVCLCIISCLLPAAHTESLASSL